MKDEAKFKNSEAREGELEERMRRKSERREKDSSSEGKAERNGGEDKNEEEQRERTMRGLRGGSSNSERGRKD